MSSPEPEPAAEPSAEEGVPTASGQALVLKRVTVSVVGAKDLCRQDGVLTGKSDPYVIVRCGKQLKKTNTPARR